MSGSRNGAATQISREEKCVFYIHCFGHAFNLAVADTIKRSKVCRDALETTLEITKLVKLSPKRNATFDRIKTIATSCTCCTVCSVQRHITNFRCFNHLADDLSRDTMVSFCSNVPQADARPAPIPFPPLLFNPLVSPAWTSRLKNISTMA